MEPSDPTEIALELLLYREPEPYEPQFIVNTVSPYEVVNEAARAFAIDLFHHRPLGPDVLH